MLLSAEESTLYDNTREICRTVLGPMVEQSPHGELNRPVIREMGAAGLIARLFPKSIGGVHDSEVSAIDLCLLREALARENTAVETALAMQGLGSYPILQSGTPMIVDRWMPGVCAGSVIPAFAMTESTAGSDAAAMSLRAEAVPGGYRINGSKTWISNAPDADVYTVFARTSDDGARGITAFCVAGGTEGLSGRAIDMLSPHPIGELTFDDVFVTDDEVLGVAGGGFKVAMQTLDLFRPSVGAFAVGMAQAALDATIAHTSQRQAFGGPLADLQAVAHKVASMAVSVHTARLSVREAARAYDRRGLRSDDGSPAEDLTLLSSMAKLHATEAAQLVIDAAVQLHGAAGLQRDHLMERLYRDVRAPRIYEGASEVQLTIISRALYRS